METILFIFSVIAIVVGIIFFVVYISSVSMTLGNGDVRKWSTYKQFMKAFRQCTWVTDDRNRFSFFPERFNPNKHYVHAGIFIIDYTGYILYPLSYLRVMIYLMWIWRPTHTYPVNNKYLTKQAIKEIL